MKSYSSQSAQNQNVFVLSEEKNMSRAQLQTGPLPPPLTLHPAHLPFPRCSNTTPPHLTPPHPTKQLIWKLLLKSLEIENLFGHYWLQLELFMLPSVANFLLFHSFQRYCVTSHYHYCF